MAIVVIYSPDPNVQDLLSLNLATGLLMNPVIRKTPNDVFELIKKLDSIDLVVMDARTEVTPYIDHIYKLIKDSNLNTKIAVIGPKLNYPDIYHSDEVKDWKKMIFEFLLQTGITKEKIKEREVFPYLPIPARMFRFLKRLPGDVFIQLKSPDNIRYVKRFNIGEVIMPNDYNHLLSKVDNFYVASDIRGNFVKEISQTLLIEIQKTTHNEVERFEHHFTLIKMLTSELGITAEVAAITEKCLDDMVKVASHEPRLKSFIEEIYLNNSAGFQSRLTQLTTVLCGSLIHFLQFKNPEEQIRKLSFVTLFHDFLLEEHLLHVRNMTDFEEKVQNTDSQRLVLNHAKAASLYFLNFPDVDHDSIQILKEHHGSRIGVGFPVPPEDLLLGLSHIFIICEELAYQLIQTGNLKNLSRILDTMSNTLKTNDNAKYLKAMKEVSQISLLT